MATVATIVIAVFSAALVHENEWLRAFLGTLTMGMILNAMLASIFSRGEIRAKSLSFFLGAIFFLFGLYSYIASLPYLVTIKLFEFLEASSTTTPDDENFFIVAGIFWLQATCHLSAMMGLRWYRASRVAIKSEMTIEPSLVRQT